MRQLVIVVALVGCKNPEPSDTRPGDPPPRSVLPIPMPAPSASADWSARTLVTTEGTRDGIAFSLEIPASLPRDERTGDWDSDARGFDGAPRVYTSTIESRRVKSLDDAKYFGTLDARQQRWIRQEAGDSGYALTMAPEDRHRIEVIVYRRATDDMFIKCKAVQANDDGPLARYDETRTMLERICDSLEIHGVEEASR